MKLDKTKPYGQIFGHTDDNAKFKQNGKRFDIRGEEIKKGKVGNATPEPEPEPEPEVPDEKVTSSVETLKAGEIKQLVEANGGDYKNKAQGIEFLQGLNRPESEEESEDDSKD